MGLYKISIKRTATINMIKIEKGMSVEVVSTNKPMGNAKGKEAIRTAFMNKYNIDVGKLMNSGNMSEEKIN
jgi:hypothetical protein